MLERFGRLSFMQQRLLLILACLILFFVMPIHMPMTEIDEVRYTEATREMFTSGSSLVPQEKVDWMRTMSERIADVIPSGNAERIHRAMVRDYYRVIPYFNYVPRYKKPIMYYWVQLSSVALFGVKEYAARFPSALLAFLLVLGLHAFLYRWMPYRFSQEDDEPAQARARGAAFFGGVALASMPMITIWAHAATTDITLTFFTTVAILAMMQADLIAATTAPEVAIKSVRKWYVLCAIALGFAFLTKGPVGIIIPGLAWLIYHGMQRDLGAEARRVPWVAALAIFFIIWLPWYVITYFYDTSIFLRSFFLTENLERYAGTPMEGHGLDNRFLAFFIYIPIALITLFPFSASLVRDIFSPLADAAQLRSNDILARLRRFAWIWLAVDLAVFAPSRTQLPSYIQALAGAAAILFALHLLGRLQPDATPARTTAARCGQWCEWVLMFVLGIAFIALPIYALITGKVNAQLGAYPIPQTAAYVVVALLAVIGVAWLVAMIKYTGQQNANRYFAWAIGGWVSVMMVLMLGVAPLVVKSQYHYSVEAGRFIEQLHTDEPVMTFTEHTSEDLVYYSRRHVDLYVHGDEADSDRNRQFNKALQTHFRTAQSVVVISDEQGMAWLRPQYAVTVLMTRGPVMVLRIAPQAQ